MSKVAFQRYAWFSLVFCVLVILWGAMVRATGSGAGCGAHWPLCNGTVIPTSPQLKTWIEYSHRLTSGLSLLFVIGVYVWSKWIFPAGNFTRKAALYSMVAIFIEALIGAGLVLLRLVEHDQSLDRAISIALHLVNTLFLLGALTITAISVNESSPRWRWPVAGLERWKVRGILLGFLLLGALGALTALGDTLFPVTNLAEEFRQKFESRRHFLEQIRVFHPLIAVIWVGSAWLWLASLTDRLPFLKKRANLFLWLAAGNLAFGLANILFLAPIWMQIVHLLWAEILWILLVSLVFSAASRWQ
jgi:cytochrome c oxidase assembly protein subunit 15